MVMGIEAIHTKVAVRLTFKAARYFRDLITRIRASTIETAEAFRSNAIVPTGITFPDVQVSGFPVDRQAQT